MTLEYLERKKVESNFYLNCFRATVQITGVLILINVVLSVVAAKHLLDPKPTQWIATTIDGRLINI
ncbi:MAG: hypothetical protein VX737_05440 [Pseudomonadota bacterium]|nr:hypothetical protein [Pseudomonadota bacterium]